MSRPLSALIFLLLAAACGRDAKEPQPAPAAASCTRNADCASPQVCHFAAPGCDPDTRGTCTAPIETGNSAEYCLCDGTTRDIAAAQPTQAWKHEGACDPEPAAATCETGGCAEECAVMLCKPPTKCGCIPRTATTEPHCGCAEIIGP